MTENRRKKIAITGGGGYIGSIMIESFLAKGYEVKCIDRFYFGLQSIRKFLGDENFNFIRKDIRHVKSEDFRGIDAVIDLAGISNDPACELDEDLTDKINRQGTVNIATSAKAAGVNRYAMASSCSIYGASDGTPLCESSELKPVSLYAKSKIASEREIRNLSSNDFCVTFLRLSTVFGLSHRMRFDLIINIMTMYAFTKGKIMILGGGKQWRPLIHVKDVARAFGKVIESNTDLINGEAFNIGSNEQNYQVEKVAKTIKRVLPINVVLEMVPDDNDKRNYNVKFNKIKEILGYETKYDIEYGIREIYESLVSGEIDPSDAKTVTVKYYKYLIDSEKILDEIKIDGQLF